MNHAVLVSVPMFALLACGGAQPASSPGIEAGTATKSGKSAGTGTGAGEEYAAESGTTTGDGGNVFKLNKSDTSASAHGVNASKIRPTRTEAALKFIVVDKDKGAIPGVVVSLTAPTGSKYYTEETDANGFAEVLVPVGQTYDLVYLSLGRRDISAKVPVADKPSLTIKLTLRYKRYVYAGPPKDEPGAVPAPAPRFVLKGVEFDTGKATISSESFVRLDRVVEYMTHKKSARIEISGHTDNVGNPKRNKALSKKRAKACRDYLTSKGIDGSRIAAIGYGDEKPIASNDTEAGRQRNRRIEANEI